MKGCVIFYTYSEFRELLRYSLKGESEGEREATAELLAYENGLDVSDIGIRVIEG